MKNKQRRKVLESGVDPLVEISKAVVEKKINEKQKIPCLPIHPGKKYDLFKW